MSANTPQPDLRIKPVGGLSHGTPYPPPQKPECPFCKKIREMLMGGLAFVRR